jgi:hypothetical protein
MARDTRRRLKADEHMEVDRIKRKTSVRCWCTLSSMPVKWWQWRQVYGGALGSHEAESKGSFHSSRDRLPFYDSFNVDHVCVSVPELIR